MTNTELSRSDSRQLAVASATLGPWKAAAVTGAVGGAVALGVDVITLHWSTSILAGPVGIALFLFFLVGGVGSVATRGHHDQKLRRWAAEHPWQVALAPAGGFFVLDLIARSFLSGAVLSSLWTSLWQAALLTAVVGVVGSVTAGRRRRSSY
jgi:hypothetical protein